ncbi:hypothetical protein [Flaviaesturariibacter amylovorans]|uniref:Uncharacterized protein n=1 Tax=Flaviaesturariibacter amylovorans TaxID=1084520 RepID=A0ABP8HG40_9BACT
MRTLLRCLLLVLLAPAASAQNTEKVVFDPADSTDGYYLAVRPRSGTVRGVLALAVSFTAPESVLPETKLHNVASANDLLTVYFSLKQKPYADSVTVQRIDAILRDAARRFGADGRSFVLAGHDYAGPAVLRYTGLAAERPALLRPQGVFTVDSPVDLFGLWRWIDRQVRNGGPGAGDARYLTELMTAEHGTPSDRPAQWAALTPFRTAVDSTGNERALQKTPLRLYYDDDITWQLQERGNSLFDTHLPDATELLRRLRAGGNRDAELVTAKTAAHNSRGLRSANALSIVDEVDCIHWIKNLLGIFDPHTWKAPFFFAAPAGWGTERFALPASFAPDLPLKGVEDIRFAPGFASPKSGQYWAYTYLWWLEGAPAVDAARLQQYFKAYYDGLVAVNMRDKTLPADKMIATTVTIKKTKTVPGEPEAYEGSVRLLDYQSLEPVTLRLTVQVQPCTAQGRTALLVAAAPHAFGDPTWKELRRIGAAFSCTQ